jgi:hypothetical protein
MCSVILLVLKGFIRPTRFDEFIKVNGHTSNGMVFGEVYYAEGDRVAMPFSFCFLELNEII